jgi:pyruvate-formate lyase-activating enzyme
VKSYAPVGDWLYRQASPREVVLRLGFRCNQRCGFCWQSREWPDAPEDYYHRWVDEVADAGRRAVCFSGGEPTLHAALPSLVARASGRGLRVMLQTNAVRLAQREYLKALCDAGLRAVFVSYHSHLPAVSDAMTRAPGTHGRTEEGLRRCLEAGLEVSLNTVVERDNHALLGALAEAVVARFVAPYPDNPVATVSLSHPSPYYDRERWKGAAVSLEALRPALVACAGYLEDHGVTVEGLGTCGFPACALRDDPRLLRRATLAREDLHDQEGRAYGRRCEACAARGHCLGVKRDYLDEHGEAGLVPFTADPFA